MKKERATLRKEYFEEMYTQNPDPWDFEKSEYEDKKYKKTIASLGKEKYESVLELGCSIGVLSKMLAERCDELLAIDLSPTALQSAKKRLAKYKNVKLLNAGIPKEYPTGSYDLIVMSEVGYYLSIQDLMKSKSLIKNSLRDGAELVLVHWTHDVKDYPLSGNQVHEIFLKDADFKSVNEYRTPDYRLDVLIKKIDE